VYLQRVQQHNAWPEHARRKKKKQEQKPCQTITGLSRRKEAADLQGDAYPATEWRWVRSAHDLPIFSFPNRTRKCLAKAGKDETSERSKALMDQLMGHTEIQ
jgi:hypothetical protein